MLSTRTFAEDGDGARGNDFERIPSCGRCPGRPSRERCHAQLRTADRVWRYARAWLYAAMAWPDSGEK
jgi:hypothetical protein